MSDLVDRDREHLRLLKVGYNILSAITAFYSLVPLLFCFVGSLVLSGAIPMPPQRGSREAAQGLGTVILGIGLAIFIAGIAYAFLLFLTARSLRDHRRRTLCLVMAALSCFAVPWGTILGVCTFIVLERASVKALFGESSLPIPNTPPP